MILPDLRCERCGRPRSFYVTKDGRRAGYCNFCRREAARRQGVRVIDHARCPSGHPKTPWNYRVYGGTVRCVECAKASVRKRSVAA